MPIVVSDTSPIRALDHLGLLNVLGVLFDQILVTPAVVRELAGAGLKIPDESGTPGWLLVQSPTDNQRVVAIQEEEGLDPGESESIVLAIERGVQQILMDERDGREVARRLGLQPIGVIGLLVTAKSHGLVATVAPLLDQLSESLNFYISSELRREALRLAGESEV